MRESTMPMKCSECERNKTCQSYFGGLGCKHKKEIEEYGQNKKLTR